MQKLSVLYSTELWEKFNFYGMRTIFSLFAVYYLGYSQQETVLYYGAYLGLCYISPIIGGVLGDRVLGYKKAVLVGTICLCVAQLILFISASLSNIDLARSLTLIALGLVIAGNGFFKPNISSNLIASVDDPKMVDAVFTRYYFFLNLGVLFGTIVVPFVADKTVDGLRDIEAFKYGFLATFFAMAIGIAFYLFNYAKIPESKINRSKIHLDKSNLAKAGGIFLGGLGVFMSIANQSNWIEAYLYPVIYASAFGVSAYILLDKSLNAQERKNILSIMVCGGLVAFFWASVEQSGSSLTFIANNQVNREFFGWEIPPSMFQMFNPLFVLVITWIIASIWQNLASQNRDLSNFTKASIGLGIISFSFVIMAVISKDLGNNLLPAKWLVLLYLISAVGECMVSPIMFALVGKKSPERSRSVIYGLFYISNAMGYAVSGSLAKLLPPSIKDYQQAEKLGINLSEVLSNPNPQLIEQLKAHHITYEYQSLWGYQVTSYFDFFMIFGLICAVCASLLFSLNYIFGNDEAGQVELENSSN